MLNQAILLAVGWYASLAAANTPIDNSVFTNDPLTAVKAAAPLWHFDVKTCFPTAATQPNGSQTPNITQDDCGVLAALNAGCPAQAAQTQQEQISTSFPTYYTIRQCSDSSWRIVYDVFFQKVKSSLGSLGLVTEITCSRTPVTPTTGNGLPSNSCRILTANTSETEFGWSRMEITHTPRGPAFPTLSTGRYPSSNLLGIWTLTHDKSAADEFQYNNQNRDHPKTFFGKWKHNVALVFNDDYGNDCLGAIIEKSDYHSDDYAFYAADNLLIDTTVPGKFSALLVGLTNVMLASYSYGNADSTPQSFESGGAYDICGSKFT